MASMRPRRIRRGTHRRTITVIWRNTPERFNEAPANSPGNVRPASKEWAHRLDSFNEAPANSPGNASVAGSGAAGSSALQ